MTYMDGSKPGNPLRPDDGRAFEAAYWMFHEWPEHLRRQAKSWLTFMYIRVADLRKTGCPTSVVAKSIIRKFWLESELHLLGSHVVVAGRQHRIVIKFGGHMGDDKDVYEWGSCNGASSNKNLPMLFEHGGASGAWRVGWGSVFHRCPLRGQNTVCALNACRLLLHVRPNRGGTHKSNYQN